MRAAARERSRSKERALEGLLVAAAEGRRRVRGGRRRAAARRSRRSTFPGARAGTAGGAWLMLNLHILLLAAVRGLPVGRIFLVLWGLRRLVRRAVRGFTGLSGLRLRKRRAPLPSPGRLEVDHGAGRHIAEAVDVADAGYVGVVLPILDPQRHRRGVNLLHGANAEPREIA
jgi:hypothetical protein